LKIDSKENKQGMNLLTYSAQDRTFLLYSWCQEFRSKLQSSTGRAS